MRSRYLQTGRLLTQTAGLSGSNTVQDHRYTWDAVGQLTQRIDARGDGSSGIAVTDTFVYDEIVRLKQTTVAGAVNASYQYDLNGNAIRQPALHLAVRRKPCAAAGDPNKRPGYPQNLEPAP